MLLATPSDPTTAIHPPTRDAILDAAEQRFGDRGFDGVSVREIAADAGLKNQASLYHYFTGKHAIYEAVLARAITSVAALVAESERRRVSAAGGEGGRAEAVAAHIDALLDYLVAHPQIARLIQRAALDDNAFVRDIVPVLVQPLYEQGLRALRDQQVHWEPEQLPYLAAGLYHLIFGYFANAALLRTLLNEDPAHAGAIAHQRRFLHGAVAQLLGTNPR